MKGRIPEVAPFEGIRPQHEVFLERKVIQQKLPRPLILLISQSIRWQTLNKALTWPVQLFKGRILLYILNMAATWSDLRWQIIYVHERVRSQSNQLWRQYVCGQK